MAEARVENRVVPTWAQVGLSIAAIGCVSVGTMALLGHCNPHSSLHGMGKALRMPGSLTLIGTGVGIPVALVILGLIERRGYQKTVHDIQVSSNNTLKKFEELNDAYKESIEQVQQLQNRREQDHQTIDQLREETQALKAQIKELQQKGQKATAGNGIAHTNMQPKSEKGDDDL